MAGAVGAVVQDYESFEGKPSVFSQDSWNDLRPILELSADPGCVLGGLAQDLAITGRFNQKPEQLVLQTLGRPDRRLDTELVYAVGQCHGWGWRHSELVLQLSAEATVSRVELRASL